jgi:hydroxymethylpyrimidine pyrophosphatase-like HAD family hydrolase
MYCRVFACDFDGTGAAESSLTPALAEALCAARAQGFLTLLVTGRVLKALPPEEAALFTAVVAENGAVVWLSDPGRTIQIGMPPPAEFLDVLRAEHVPFHVRDSLVGIDERHAGRVLQLLRKFGLDWHVTFEPGELLLLPGGVNRAVGVRCALKELASSEHNLIAFGDAHHDPSVLALAEVGVAAHEALPGLAMAADEHLTESDSVARYIRRVVAARGIVPTPPRQSQVLGRDASGAAVLLPYSGINVLLSGDPRSGKSWLAGLIVERLLEREYRLCIVDPEGDYLAFAPRLGITVLGDDLQLPAPATLPRLFHDEGVSFVLVLSSLSLAEKQAYVEVLLAELDSGRAVTGLPHWILLDETHYFLGHGACAARFLQSRTGNFLLVTYRPSLLSRAVHRQIGAHLLTETAVEAERSFIAGLLRDSGPAGAQAAGALQTIRPPRAGLLVRQEAGVHWKIFTPAPRFVSHAHHGRKYADFTVPENLAFRFLHINGGPTPVAHSIAEFCLAVKRVPPSSLRHHLCQGDFSRWAADVLHDATLARRLAKLEHAARLGGAPPSRAEILKNFADRYLV